MHNLNNILIRNNEISGSPTGIHMKYHGEATNTTIEGNTIHDTVTGIVGSNSSYTVRNNVFYNSPTGMYIGACNVGLCGGHNVNITNNTIMTALWVLQAVAARLRTMSLADRQWGLMPEKIWMEMVFPTLIFQQLTLIKTASIIQVELFTLMATVDLMI